MAGTRRPLDDAGAIAGRLVASNVSTVDSHAVHRWPAFYATSPFALQIRRERAGVPGKERRFSFILDVQQRRVPVAGDCGEPLCRCTADCENLTDYLSTSWMSRSVIGCDLWPCDNRRSRRTRIRMA